MHDRWNGTEDSINFDDMWGVQRSLSDSNNHIIIHIRSKQYLIHAITKLSYLIAINKLILDTV